MTSSPFNSQLSRSQPSTPGPQVGSVQSPAPYSQSPFKSLYTPSPPPPQQQQQSQGRHASPARRRSLLDDGSRIRSETELPTASKPVTPRELPKGEWRHPAFDQVQERTSQTEFTQNTGHKMFLNALAWIAYAVVIGWLRKWNWMADLTAQNEIFRKNMTYIGIALQLLFLWNIVDGLVRLLRPREKFADIPLTPSQRKLMGLDDKVKTSSPAKPLTPPKYVKGYSQARESPRASPLLKKSIQGAAVDKNKNSSPKSAGNQVASPNSPARSTGSPVSSSGFTPSNRYLYMADSPGRSPGHRSR
ncbi:nuclear pore complex component-domain-containing protein [Lipomyces japonicus]|uniref:nuclear pore complex component-domain-containing protein n=1 Tax=Lipomyces japonicus TaxID=56871 RepID=UPI0034CE8F70